MGEAPLMTAAHVSYETGSTSLTIDASRLSFACPLDLAGMVATAHVMAQAAMPVTLRLPQDPAVASYLQRLDVLRHMPSRTRIIGRVPPETRTEQAHRLLEVTRLTPDNVADIGQRMGRLLTAHFADTSPAAGRIAYRACGELLANASEHGASDIGAFVAVQAYTGRTQGTPRLELAVCDSGIGVLQHLRGNPRHAHLSDDQAALRLAVQQGVSGAGDDRGNGLADLVEYSRTQGYTRLQIRSGAGQITVTGTAAGIGSDVAPRPDRTAGTWAWLSHHVES